MPSSRGRGVPEQLGQWSGPPPSAGDVDPLRLVVIRLQGIEHAVPVEYVVEVFRMVAITPLAEAPSWVHGVIDLRGQVIPVIDLRSRLGMSERAPDLATPILVVRAQELTAGLVADEVVEVLTLPSEAVSVPGKTVPRSAVASAIRYAGRLLLVLDIDRVCDGVVDLARQGNGHLV